MKVYILSHTDIDTHDSTCSAWAKKGDALDAAEETAHQIMDECCLEEAGYYVERKEGRVLLRDPDGLVVDKWTTTETTVR